MPGDERSAGSPSEGGPQWGRQHDGDSRGQWTAPPGPSARRGRSRGCIWGCAGALGVVGVIIVVVLLITLGNGEETTTPAPNETTTGSATQEAQTDTERQDLVSFQLDDRSTAGIKDIWLVWTIRNSSSEESDYSWQWEAVAADGTRLENGSQLETDVQPGQTAEGEFPTTLKDADGVELNITKFDRTASY